jgi:glyoxylase-like metal-dependent hydrolase (beta-lactamase superfamily II)
MNEEIYEFKLGDFRCWAIQDSNSSESVAQTFLNTKPEEIEAAASRYGFALDGTIDISYTALLIDTGKEKILIDSGWGVDTGGNGRLFGNLERLGISRESIDKLVLTHAHADHYAGLLSKEGALNFPNAKHFIWRGEWEFYSGEERLAFEKNRSEPHYNFIVKYFLAMRPHWHFLDEAQNEISEGVCAISAKGHSKEHIAIRLESNGEVLYVVGDAFLHPAFVENWHWGFGNDLVPEEASASRKMLAARISGENAKMLAYHFPFPGIGRVVAEGDKFYWQG